MIYLIVCPETMTCKVGKSGNVKQRLQALQSSNPHKLYLVKEYIVYECHEMGLEFKLHKYLKEYNVHGEWFHYSKKLKQEIHYFMYHFHYQLVGIDLRRVIAFEKKEAKKV